MPCLNRLPAQDGQPAGWLLLVQEDEHDEAQHEALEMLLSPDGPVSSVLALNPESAVGWLEFELCDACPVMKWRTKAPGVIHVSLKKVVLKALVELWELSTQGAGEYAFEVLDLTADPLQPSLTYLTLRAAPSGE